MTRPAIRDIMASVPMALPAGATPPVTAPSLDPTHATITAEAAAEPPVALHAAATPPDLATTAPFYPPHVARRRDGWTAEKQRLFLSTLADTGSVTHAAIAVFMTPRSAHRLRNHPAGTLFAQGWDAALATAAGRLTTIAFERAIEGTPREVWRDGELVHSVRVPSDRMLMFLLSRLAPDPFAAEVDPVTRSKTIAAQQARLAPVLAALTDAPVQGDALHNADLHPQPPLDEQP